MIHKYFVARSAKRDKCQLTIHNASVSVVYLTFRNFCKHLIGFFTLYFQSDVDYASTDILINVYYRNIQGVPQGFTH